MTKLIYIGLPKTGSSSFTCLMNPYLNSVHEYDHLIACKYIWERKNSGTHSDNFRQYFEHRKKLIYGCDVGTFYHQCIHDIPLIYNKSLFIAIIREPAAWIASALVMLLEISKNRAQHTAKYNKFIEIYAKVISKHISFEGIKYQMQMPKYKDAIYGECLNYWCTHYNAMLEFKQLHNDKTLTFNFDDYFKNPEIHNKIILSKLNLLHLFPDKLNYPDQWLNKMPDYCYELKKSILIDVQNHPLYIDARKIYLNEINEPKTW